MSQLKKVLRSLAPLMGASLFLVLAPALITGAPLLYDQPLSKKYHRLEVVVPPDFKATCSAKPLVAKCKVSLYTPELLRLFKLGAREGIRVETNEARKEVNFFFTDPKMVLQDKLLDGPPRWVLEAGYQEVLIQPIEDELPFRPYPMPVQTVRLERPKMALDPLDGDSEEAVFFNQCWALWKVKKYVDAFKECDKITSNKMLDSNRPAARSANRLIGEILYAYLKGESSTSEKIKAFIGSEVFVRGNQIKFEGYPVRIGYSINGKVGQAKLTIKDAKGGTVFQGQIAPGEQGAFSQIEWEGRDSSESELPPGEYTVDIEVTPDVEVGTPEPLSAQSYVKGKINKVYFDNGVTELLVDKRRVRLSEVILPGNKGALGLEGDQKYFFTRDPNQSPRDVAIARLKTAEKAAVTDREKARYVLLASDLISMQNINVAIAYLKTAQMRYRQTEAEPYLLAERARLFLDSSKYDEATQVLEEIARLDPQQQQDDVIGTRLLALASLAYTRRDYTTATSLYDQAIERFPTLLLEKSSAVFQLAELYFRSRRLAEAKPFYQDFLSRFPGADPEWIARIRLVQINSFERPQEAFNDMRELGETLSSEEGKQLAALYALTLSTNRLRGASPDSVFKLIGKGTPSDYVLEEMWMQQARHSLREDRLQDAFRYSQEIVQRAPNSALLIESSLFFQRLLLLQVDYLLREGKNIDLVLLYFKEKSRRFRQPARRGLLHLYVARAMRDLKMLDEALNNVIARGGLPGERDPNIEALLNLEFTGILREKIQDRDFSEDDERDSISRFKQAVESLDARFPNRFDNFDYWASRGYYKELQGQLRQAKEIYLYALNGPKIKPEDRMELAESIYQVYLKMPDYDKALNAITVLLNIYNEYKDQLNMPAFRVNTLWRRVELHIEREAWAELIPAIQDYLEESQSVIPALSGSLDGSSQTRDSAFMQAELEIDRRREALFFQGYAFLKLKDERSAKRLWDLLYKEAPKHVYGKLAEYELFMLSWRNLVSPEVLKLIDP